MKLPGPKYLSKPFILGALIPAMFFFGSCDLFDVPGTDCQGSDCEYMPRMAVGILPSEVELDYLFDSLDIQFVDNMGDVSTNHPSDNEVSVYSCSIVSPYTDGMLWTACAASGPAVEWIDVTISLGDEHSTTERIELADHNYCGEDIAYVLVTLHEDSSPTFGEVMYVSPCEGL